MNKTVIAFVVAALIIGIAGLSATQARPLEGVEAVIYKSSTCGCCTLYAEYLERLGAKVQVVTTEDLNSLKASLGIPGSVQSCHTVKIGHYFIEGHVPKEAIVKLLKEKPDVEGIALPGMPSGSPGMPGPKTGAWTIYSIDGGNVKEFMKV